MRPKHQEVVQKPEHDFSRFRQLTNKAAYWGFQYAVFDNACEFFTGTMRQREAGGYLRTSFGGDLQAAINHVLATPRTCVYACTSAGRGICLDTKDWPMWLARLEASHGDGLDRQNSK